MDCRGFEYRKLKENRIIQHTCERQQNSKLKSEITIRTAIPKINIEMIF